MREQLKQQFREMLKTLGTAEGILDSRSKKKDGDAVHQLLEDMQNSAIAIGTAIEQEEGEGTQTVKGLEEYCELLWQYLIASELKERFQLGRQLAGKRSEVLTLLETEIAGYLEIVFLVCKGDNWQYLEPYWELFKDHASCNCQVLSASYYYRLENGSVGVTHDEAGMFPEEMNVMEFENYDLEKQKPDIVFIDGPWSGGKAAGLVPEYDYGRVREAAGTLIYVPGYEDGAQPDEEDGTLAQVETADLVLLPSDEIVRIYKAQMKAAGIEYEFSGRLCNSESVRSIDALLKVIAV